MKLHSNASNRAATTFKTLEQRCHKVHKNIYDYSESVYLHMREKFTIVCKEHGSFLLTPDEHLQGQGCRKCTLKRKRQRESKQKYKKFIESAKNKFGSKFNYTKICEESFQIKLKVTIICSKHGESQQIPYAHLNSKYGCRKCANLHLGPIHETKSDFVKKAQSTHGNLYNYSKVQYIDSRTSVVIICNKHGEFKQRPSRHIAGSNCPKCATEIGHNKLTKKVNKFIKEAAQKHNFRYSYNKTTYTHSRIPVTVTCLKHGDFKQQPANHLNGTGCPFCTATGFNKDKPGILYYLKIQYYNQITYKIGITNRTIEERFGADMEYITVLAEKRFEIGQDAYDKEQYILNKYKKFQYKGFNVLKSGNTEMFIKDVLKKDQNDNR